MASSISSQKLLKKNLYRRESGGEERGDVRLVQESRVPWVITSKAALRKGLSQVMVELCCTKVYLRSPEPWKYLWFSCIYLHNGLYGAYSYLLTGRDSGLMTYITRLGGLQGIHWSKRF